MTDRRSFLAAALVAPITIVAPAIAAIPSGQHPDWLTLLANERRLHAAFNAMVDEQEEADDRFYTACRNADQEWQRRFDDHRSFPKIPHIEGESADDRELRIQAAIRTWNAEGQALRDAREERDTNRARLREETGLAEVEGRWAEACDAHTASLRAIVAYPSRDPDIIAHKLRMMMERYGDNSGELEPLFKSITGKA